MGSRRKAVKKASLKRRYSAADLLVMRRGNGKDLDYSSTILLQFVPEMSVSMPLKTIYGMFFEISNRLFLVSTKSWIILPTVPILEIRNLR